MESALFEGTTDHDIQAEPHREDEGGQFQEKTGDHLDLRRSGGKGKAVLPERPVLLMDAIAMMRRMHAAMQPRANLRTKPLELVTIDKSDAYMYLAVAEEEKGDTA